VAATFLNSFLNELININTVVNPDGTNTVKSRVDIAVIGYGQHVSSALGDALVNKSFVTLTELQMNPIDVELVKKKEIDDTGNIIEIPTYFPIWVKAKAENGAASSMLAALQQARSLAEQWALVHQDNYPPLVINITNGLAAGDLVRAAQDIMQIQTNDGQALVFNMYITHLPFSEVVYPRAEAELPNNPDALQLFAMSSIIPETSRALLESMLGHPVPPGARGMSVNSNLLSSVRFLFNFVSAPAILRRGPVTREAYNDAISNPLKYLNLSDMNIRYGHVEKIEVKTRAGAYEVPWGVEGSFAVVYKFRTQSGQFKALRCFRGAIRDDIQYRYEQIGAYFSQHLPTTTAKFVYYDTGINVKVKIRLAEEQMPYPLIVMDWIEGVSLLEKVDQLCQQGQHDVLRQLAEQWLELFKAMRKAKVAHGDLSGEHIIVKDDGSLILLDYDGAYIPHFRGLPPVVIGQADYQHPEMRRRPFDEYMDTFSAYVIYIALLALHHRPRLWQIYTYHSPEGKLLSTHMLFTRDDFLNSTNSPLFADMQGINDPVLSKALAALQQACSQPIERIHLLHEALESIEGNIEEVRGDTKYNNSVYGPVKGLIQGEHNTITINYQNDTERIVPFLPPPQPPSSLVGRDKLIKNLKQRLFGGGNLSLSALNGLPGVGKTALALALAHDREVLEHFCDGILWAGLGRESNVLSYLNVWGIALGIAQLELEKLTSLSTLTQRVHGAIGIRRMLLVIDDAWSPEAALAFKLGGPNCAHLVTTRLPEVAERFASEGIVVVQELDEHDGLILLERLAPGVTKTMPDEAQELIRAVGGLPLPLTLMGNYLRIQMRTGQSRRLRTAIDRLRKMQDRLELSQPQAGLERHPSLPEGVPLSQLAVIKISDEALNEESRQALRALSVFPSKPNTFSEEAALAVITASTHEIDTLTDFGLLESTGPSRYTLHQTISDYAATELTDATVYERMMAYFIKYVESHKADNRLLEQETGNILAALEVMLERGMNPEGASAFAHFIRILRRRRTF
jgi:hypothetical protein